MTEVPPPVQRGAQYPPPALAEGSRAMAGTSLGLGISALIPCLGVITGIIGIILGIVALAKRKAGQAMAIAGIIVGAFGILIFQALGAAILVPSVVGIRHAKQKAVCAANVHLIGASIQMYRTDHRKYPANLGELVSEGLMPDVTCRCPGASKGTARPLSLKDGREISSNYFYLPPPGADPETIVLCDYRDNHEDGRTVLYSDGSARFLEREVFNRELALPRNGAFAEAIRKAEPP